MISSSYSACARAPGRAPPRLVGLVDVERLVGDEVGERVRDAVEQGVEALLREDVVEDLGEAPVRLDERLGAAAPFVGDRGWGAGPPRRSNSPGPYSASSAGNRSALRGRGSAVWRRRRRRNSPGRGVVGRELATRGRRRARYSARARSRAPTGRPAPPPWSCAADGPAVGGAPAAHEVAAVVVHEHALNPSAGRRSSRCPCWTFHAAFVAVDARKPPATSRGVGVRARLRVHREGERGSSAASTCQ